MPTYEYECSKCGHEFERFENITAEPTRRCPECGGKVKRLLGTGAGILFKGSGFYQTDYRTEGYKKSAEADKPDKGSSESKKKEKPGGGAGPEKGTAASSKSSKKSV